MTTFTDRVEARRASEARLEAQGIPISPPMVEVGHLTTQLNDGRRGTIGKMVEVVALALKGKENRPTLLRYPNGVVEHIPVEGSRDETTPVGTVSRRNRGRADSDKPDVVEVHRIAPDRLHAIEAIDPDRAAELRKFCGIHR